MTMTKKVAVTLAVMALASTARAELALDRILRTPGAAAVNGAEVISASDSQEGDVMRLIAEKGEEAVKIIVTPNGRAATCTSKASYAVYPNPDATLIAKRLAYVTAYIRAKNKLIEFVDGLNSVVSTTITDRSERNIDQDRSSLNSGASYRETIAQELAGRLQYFTVYKVQDLPREQEGEVSVTLAVSRKSAQNCRAVSEGFIEAQSLEDGVQYVYAELNKGVLPPVGGKMITVPQTGEVAIVSVGSDIVVSSGALARSQEIARRRARARAVSAMIEILKGSDVGWKYGSAEYTDPNFKEFETIAQQDKFGNQTESLVRLNATNKEFLDKASHQEDLSEAVNGRLPRGVQEKVYFSSDGAWCFCVKVYTPSLTLSAQRLKRELTETEGAARVAERQAGSPLPPTGERMPRHLPKGPDGHVQTLDEI